ncbi:peptidase S28 [Cristinia sonorae]|uniref:Peptidase S28 n=1 Tax=Cristinia sonorae TaxID=1940300 RepID=A0A8K0UNJ9_9AGAR|nr:peptidase S28 [Cristinia sonorae]
MKLLTATVLASVALANHWQLAVATQPFRAQSVNIARLLANSQNANDAVEAQATFPVYTFTQPLDHFTDTGHTFEQRYWVSARHYNPNATTPVPVIVLDGGEGAGDRRFPFLDTGIVDILTKATGGLGVVLEHRYYGQSIPVQNFTTDSLRWLNNEQALADSANFIANVKFPGIDTDLTAPNTPWIYYGGSYAGARAAHMRVLYPELVYGAIASSAVTVATIDNWRYSDIIRRFAPQDCIKQILTTMRTVDELLLKGGKHRDAIKQFFGMGAVTHDVDFASMLDSPFWTWQNTNWDAGYGDPRFFAFCDDLGEPDDKEVKIASGIKVNSALARFAAHMNKTYVSQCVPPQTQDECFGTFNPGQYSKDDISQSWRLWGFQVCTQWAYFDPPPPVGIPSLRSRLITLEYDSKACRLAYPPGEHFQVPVLPDVESVNRLGGFDIAADRLAFIDGEADPWRSNTPHADEAKPRADTTLRPFKYLPGAVHHWDENGLSDPSAEPPLIQQIHKQQVDFVKAWLKDFKPPQ